MTSIKKIFYALAIGVFATSCSYETIRVSDEVSTREYDFENITALSVATDFKAYVTFSETEESVRIKANDNLFGKIRVYQDGGRLTVKLKNVNIKGKETLQLYITMKEIRDYKASSDAAIYLDDPLNANDVKVELSSDAYFKGDITANDFELRGSSDSTADLYVDAPRVYMNLSSSAKVEGEMESQDATFKLTSDSVIDLVGTADNLKANLSSDSRLKDYGLQVEDLEISLSSDSDAYLTVSETIDVTASSDARLFYKGDAEVVRQVLSSDGRVIKKD
ncbi:head GIN domain-containing protein [Flagellimonas sp.]|uniref:head GIN domain-containing protein n=1 Tax=Flagellimonas sp. TaxID=2058762 RepID=UPI003B5B6435